MQTLLLYCCSHVLLTIIYIYIYIAIADVHILYTYYIHIYFLTILMHNINYNNATLDLISFSIPGSSVPYNNDLAIHFNCTFIIFISYCC